MPRAIIGIANGCCIQATLQRHCGKYRWRLNWILFRRESLRIKGIIHYYLRQYDEAIEMAIKTMELDPSFVPVHRLLSLAYQGKGMYDKAIEENEMWGLLTGNDVKTKVALAHIYATAGRKDEAKKIVDDVATNFTLSGNDHRGMALVYTALGKKDRAFYWLDKSYEKHEESLCSLKLIQSLIRFAPIHGLMPLKKIGL